MQVQRQLSVFLVNKPGMLSQVLAVLAKAKVNLIAMTVADSSEHGVLRIVTEDLDTAREALKPLNVPVTETDVLCIEIPNKPGAFASLAEKLADEHVNIQYAYCTAGAPGGRTTGVIKPDQMKKAEQVAASIGGGRKQHAGAAAGSNPARRR